MKIEPSGEDYSCLGEESPTQNYRFPDKGSVLLEVESDTRFTEWSYFWLTFCRGNVRPAWYRVFEKGKKPSEWRPLRSVEQVLQESGVDDDADDDDPEETRRGREGKIGAAEKLPAGQYQFQVKIGRENDEYELTGIEFKVKAAPAKAAPPSSEVQFSMTKPRCGMSAVASFIKLPKVAVSGLVDIARIWKFSDRPESERKDFFPEYLRVCGSKTVAEYPCGVALVTLLAYLHETHQITLMKSGYDKVIPFLTEWRKAPQFFFTDAHRNAFLTKLEGEFPEQEMREYFRDYNGVDDAEAGKKMLDGIRAIRESLSTLDKNSVTLFSIRDVA